MSICCAYCILNWDGYVVWYMPYTVIFMCIGVYIFYFYHLMFVDQGLGEMLVISKQKQTQLLLCRHLARNHNKRSYMHVSVYACVRARTHVNAQSSYSG